MFKIVKKVKKIAWIISILSAIFISLALVWRNFVPADEALLIAIIIVLFPPTILNYIDKKWRKSIDEHLPDLFKNIAQTQKTGMNIPQIIEQTSKRKFGPLTIEIRKMNTQISWGMSFEKALLALEKRLDTVLFTRTVPLLIEASKSGGRIEKVFDPLSNFLHTVIQFRRDRLNQTRPYIAIVYVAFFVFLFTIILLFKSFFISIEGLTIFGMAMLSTNELLQIFFHLTAIQAFFGGLVAGKMGEGRINAGLKHSLLLMLFGYIALHLFL